MQVTVGLTLAAFAIAFLVGTLIAAFRVSPVAPLRLAGATWVETVRNTPLTAQMLLFFFGFPKLGIIYSPFWSGVTVLAVYTSAFLAETIRAGINTVASGQAEAARAIGLTFPQTLRIVILPQAFRSVVGPIGNIFIALMKNSSVAGAVISVHDIFKVSRDLVTDTAQTIPVFIGAALAYLVLTIPSGRAFAALEKRVSFAR